MASKMMLLSIAALVLSINVVSCSTIYRSFTDEEDLEDTKAASDEDFNDDPIYQPRFLPFFDDNAASIGKVMEALQNPGNQTLQNSLLNVIADVALKQFGGDQTVKKVIEVVKNSQNKTFREIVMDVAAEVAIVKLGGEDETIRKIAEVLKNPGNKTIQDNLITLAAEIADTKLKSNGTLQKVAEVLQKPGNRTLQENLLNVVFEVGMAKYGDNELFKTVAEVFKNSGNKTMQENLLNLATSVALTKYGNNPVIKMVATSLQNSGNGTFNEKLSVMADAALTASLGPVQAAILKQGIGVAGQVLKVGGGLLGGALSDIGGDSALGKAGRAIGNGSLAVGGFMSTFGGGDKGVGAVIEKFGESLKGGNVTVKDALEMVGSTMDIPVSTVEEDVSKGIKEMVNTEEKLVEVVQNEAGSSTASAQTTALSNSKQTERVSQPMGNALTSSHKISTTIEKAPKVTSEALEVKKPQGNIKQVVGDQLTFTKAENSVEETRTGEDNTHKVEEQKKEPQAQVEQQVSKTEESSLVTNAINLADEAASAITIPKGGQIITGVGSFSETNHGSTLTKPTRVESESTTNSNSQSSIQSSQDSSGTVNDSSQGNLYSQYTVNQGVASATNNLVGSTQNNQMNPGLATNSIMRNSYSQNAVNQGLGTSMNNFVGNAQSSQVGSGYVADSSSNKVYSASQGAGSYSNSALDSAAEAIAAARQALQAGGEALGGVLGSGNSGVSTRQTGGTAGVVTSIEITQVKLNMM